MTNDRDFNREFPLTAASMRDKSGTEWTHPDDEPKPKLRRKRDWLNWVAVALILLFIGFVFFQTRYWPQ